MSPLWPHPCPSNFKIEEENWNNCTRVDLWGIRCEQMCPFTPEYLWSGMIMIHLYLHTWPQPGCKWSPIHLHMTVQKLTFWAFVKVHLKNWQVDPTGSTPMKGALKEIDPCVSRVNRHSYVYMWTDTGQSIRSVKKKNWWLGHPIRSLKSDRYKYQFHFKPLIWELEVRKKQKRK